MKCKGLLLTIVFCLLPAISVFAQEEHGYLVKLKPTAVLTIEHDDGYVLDQLQFSPQYCRVSDLEEVETYIGMENVESVEPRRSLELFDMPNDPYYDTQWAYTDLRTEYARLAGLDGKGVRIAVIDSGIYRDHEEFYEADIEDGENFARISATDHTVEAEDVTDYIGHGTAVTSIIVAGTDNDLGGCGIAPEATIVPLRCFSLTEGYDDWAAEAIYAAVDEYDCDIINMSFGESIPSTVFMEAVEYAYEKGVIMVAAVGNYGSKTELYPAAFDEVIGVGAVGLGKKWCDFSQYNDSVFITAPGDFMVTAEKNSADAYRIDRDGTSFSSPCIAAIAALALQADDTLTQTEFCALLEETAEDLGDTGYDIYYGHGMVDVEALLKELGVSLNSIAVREKASEMEVYGFVEGFQPLEEKGLVIAGYQGDGKMLVIEVPEVYQADKIGVLDIKESLTKKSNPFSEIKLFWLNDDESFPIPEDLPMKIILEQ